MIEAAVRLLDSYATGRMSRREAAVRIAGLAVAPLAIAGGADAAEPSGSTFR